MRFVQKRAVGGEQRGDAVAVAEFDALEDVRVHERLAQADQHHVLGGFARLADKTFEDFVRHIRFGLFMGFARAHGAIQIALGGGFDDIFDRQRRQGGPPRQVTPQQFCPVPGPHVYIHCNWGKKFDAEARRRGDAEKSTRRRKWFSSASPRLRVRSLGSAHAIK